MKIWLGSRWDELRANFWFVPTVMAIGATFLSLATLHLDRATPYHNRLATLGWTFTRGPEGSRAVLSTVAGTMMTITSVTFSITIVALQLASSQFGPRLLRNFMRDRGNQVALGTFIGTFTYCLLILRTINGTEGEQFVPHISVTVGLFLAMASLGVFIYFIHHAAESIQTENVLAAVSRDLEEAIDRLYPEAIGEEADDPRAGDRDVPADFDREAEPIASTRSDYIQAIDLDRLFSLAVERDLILSLPLRPGKFVFEGNDLVLAWPSERLQETDADVIRGAFYLGRRRTPAQDVEFAIDQLVEVAVRALSPGVNDPFTAINCVDRLGAALCRLAARKIPSPYRYDEEGRLRLIADRSTISGVVDAAFNQIRQSARDDAAVTLRLLECISSVGRRTRNREFLEALRRQADLVRRGTDEGLPEAADRVDADERYGEVVETLEEAAAEPGPDPATSSGPAA
ncbi:DUF2254 domain-containing protein [Paludisphaera rhizosphaerae]|uniref:DUF2254 domain-containing protein n=1 Tax=Paludisphaera rhizosphaerae TaxID=2711216 RepID=UPI0013EDE60E|nr:DUF2254 domain-containing protein [Paludisphaera rhizosphaerae]